MALIFIWLLDLALLAGAFESAPIRPAIVEPKPMSVGLGLSNTQLHNGTSSLHDQSMAASYFSYIQILMSFLRS